MKRRQPPRVRTYTNTHTHTHAQVCASPTCECAHVCRFANKCNSNCRRDKCGHFHSPTMRTRSSPASPTPPPSQALYLPPESDPSRSRPPLAAGFFFVAVVDVAGGKAVTTPLPELSGYIQRMLSRFDAAGELVRLAAAGTRMPRQEMRRECASSLTG